MTRASVEQIIALKTFFKPDNFWPDIGNNFKLHISGNHRQVPVPEKICKHFKLSFRKVCAKKKNY
jgi:hypothetical protein